MIRVIAIVATGFDGLYGQDAYAYFDQAMALRAALLEGIAVPPGFLWPQGYPALVTLMSLAVGPNLWAAQLVSLLMGSLVAPLTFLVGRRLLPSGNEGAAVLAAVLTAIGGQAVLSSIVSMSDASAMVLILLSMWTALEFRDAPHRPSLLVLAVILGGAAMATRWASMLVGPALAVPALVALTRGRRPRCALPALITTACAGSGVLLFVLLHVEAFEFAGYFRGWSLLNTVWGPIPQIPSDSLAAKAPGLLYSLAPLYHPAFLGPLLGPLAGWGLWRLWRDHDRISSLTLALWAGIPLFFFAGFFIRSLRFCLTNAVPLTLLAAWGAWTLVPKPIAGRVARALIALSLALITAWSAVSVSRFTGAQARIKRTAEAVQSLAPDDAVVLAFEITAALVHRTDLEVVELYFENAASLETLVANGRPVYLLTRPDHIEARWHDQAPGINTRWLERHGLLQEIEAWGPYRLRRFEKDNSHRADHPNAEAAS
ncbi:MAG: glycosyltransferase family 39 protein [Acidobacteria bacterium]|nr:glycosyltransferase family 39 protein [Acidobacteriota bacterium]